MDYLAHSGLLHWLGAVLVAPASAVVLVASWQSVVRQRTRHRADRPSDPNRAP